MALEKMQKMLAVALLAGVASPALAQIQPLDLQGIQNQHQSVIQQQTLTTQLGTIQTQQNLNQDRIRELELFRPPQYYGTGTNFVMPPPPGNVIQPRTPVPPPAPPPPRPATPAP